MHLDQRAIYLVRMKGGLEPKDPSENPNDTFSIQHTKIKLSTHLELQ
ncbi:hypothetical protein NC652_033038 [Populus alba x Populus x berolinensis]|nr:hypothetical protein NC652_033038 [Populus alba x Populus x berolinensis]